MTEQSRTEYRVRTRIGVLHCSSEFPDASTNLEQARGLARCSRSGHIQTSTVTRTPWTDLEDVSDDD
jgi:hypothetical protein